MHEAGTSQPIVCKDIPRWLEAKEATVAAGRGPPYHARLSKQAKPEGAY
jgi:hypothetical protein